MSKFFVYVLSVFLISCNTEDEHIVNCFHESDPPRNNHKVNIKQGLWGDVWFWSGDFMPIGRGEICQVKREILIYELTTSDEVEQIGYSSFYVKINTNLIATVESDYDGFFQIELSPGIYSLFVLEEGKYYSNSFKTEGIFPVTIEREKLTDVRIDITYKATF